LQQIVMESTVVGATPDAVWAYLCDIPGMPRWRSGVLSSEWVSAASSPAPGHQFTIRWLPDRQTKSQLATVTDSVPARSFGFTINRGQLEFRFLTVALVDGHTRCQVTRVDAPGRLARLHGGDVAALAHERRLVLREMLAAIKRGWSNHTSVRDIARRHRSTAEPERRRTTPKWQRRH
jgi:hypothetical protein